jgi:superfamily II DNA or RNA helicase
MKIEKTTTGIIIHDPSDDMKRKVLRYFSLKGPVREFFIYTGKESAFPIFGNHDTIYITSGILGIKDEALQHMLRGYKTLDVPTPASVDIEVNMKPRSRFQEDCINAMLHSTKPKLAIEAKGGSGKTFMASYAISKLHLKPLIIAPTANLKNQWIENFENFGIDRKDIATNIHDGKNKKMTIVTIAALGNELRNDWQQLMKSIEDARYGIKVIDEAHLALKAIMRFDAICNIKHNWYLSATLGRSSIEEDDILNRMYLDADRFVGNASYEEYQKEYINIYLQDIHYHPSMFTCKQYLKFGKKGIIKASYYNMLMHYRNGQPFLNNVLRMAKIAKKTETYDGRILILLPMLEIIDTVANMMRKDPFFAGAKIGVINGKMPMRERIQSMECDYILSTAASAGTGVDFKNLGCVVNFDQAASLIITEQIVVRLRDRGNECWYFDIRDIVRYARSFEHWGRNRRMVLSYIPGVYADLKKLPDIRC